MNLTDELEKSFVAEPPHRPVEQRIAAGRRLVHRRRGIAAVGLLVTLAILGTGYTVIAPDGGRNADQQITDRGPRKDQERQRQSERPELGDVGLSSDGELITADGVQVLQEVENPIGVSPPQLTIGVAYDYRGVTHWAVIDGETTANGVVTTGLSTERAFRSFPTFEYWLDEQAALQNGEPPLELVRFGDGEQLLPRDGVEILQQTGDVDLGPSFASPGDRTAVAEVMYAGERWYVLARDVPDSGIQYFPTAASVSKPTLEEFLPYAARSYQAGEGLR